MGKADFSHSASQYYSYYCFVFLIIALFFLLLLCFSYYCFVFLIVDSVLCNFLPINEYVIREIIDILVVVLR